MASIAIRESSRRWRPAPPTERHRLQFQSRIQSHAQLHIDTGVLELFSPLFLDHTERLFRLYFADQGAVDVGSKIILELLADRRRIDIRCNSAPLQVGEERREVRVYGWWL